MRGETLAGKQMRVNDGGFMTAGARRPRDWILDGSYQRSRSFYSERPWAIEKVAASHSEGKAALLPIGDRTSLKASG